VHLHHATLRSRSGLPLRCLICYLRNCFFLALQSVSLVSGKCARSGLLTLYPILQMLAKLFDLEDYAGTYRETRNAYLKAANQLKLATGPYKAARDAYVAATATYTKSLYE
jgi:hypothetical protein